MKTVFPAGLTVVVGSLFLPIAQAAAQERSVASSSTAGKIVPLGIFPVPDGIGVFGNRTEGPIRVMVYGEVKQPGIYYLPAGGVVQDALKSAGGAGEFAQWYASGILRPLNAGQANWIRFTRKTKRADENIPLRDGDRVHFGGEAY